MLDHLILNVFLFLIFSSYCKYKKVKIIETIDNKIFIHFDVFSYNYLRNLEILLRIENI